MATKDKSIPTFTTDMSSVSGFRPYVRDPIIDRSRGMKQQSNIETAGNLLHTAGKAYQGFEENRAERAVESEFEKFRSDFEAGSVSKQQEERLALGELTLLQESNKKAFETPNEDGTLKSWDQHNEMDSQIQKEIDSKTAYFEKARDQGSIGPFEFKERILELNRKIISKYPHLKSTIIGKAKETLSMSGIESRLDLDTTIAKSEEEIRGKAVTAALQEAKERNIVPVYVPGTNQVDLEATNNRLFQDRRDTYAAKALKDARDNQDYWTKEELDEGIRNNIHTQASNGFLSEFNTQVHNILKDVKTPADYAAAKANIKQLSIAQSNTVRTYFGPYLSNEVIKGTVDNFDKSINGISEGLLNLASGEDAVKFIQARVNYLKGLQENNLLEHVDMSKVNAFATIAQSAQGTPFVNEKLYQEALKQSFKSALAYTGALRGTPAQSSKEVLALPTRIKDAAVAVSKNKDNPSVGDIKEVLESTIKTFNDALNNPKVTPDKATHFNSVDELTKALVNPELKESFATLSLEQKAELRTHFDSNLKVIGKAFVNAGKLDISVEPDGTLVALGASPEVNRNIIGRVNDSLRALANIAGVSTKEYSKEFYSRYFPSVLGGEATTEPVKQRVEGVSTTESGTQSTPALTTIPTGGTVVNAESDTTTFPVGGTGSIEGTNVPAKATETAATTTQEPAKATETTPEKTPDKPTSTQDLGRKEKYRLLTSHLEKSLASGHKTPLELAKAAVNKNTSPEVINQLALEISKDMGHEGKINTKFVMGSKSMKAKVLASMGRYTIGNTSMEEAADYLHRPPETRAEDEAKIWTKPVEVSTIEKGLENRIGPWNVQQLKLKSSGNLQTEYRTLEDLVGNIIMNESGGKHFNRDGGVLVHDNVNGTSDIGIMQINEKFAHDLGYGAGGIKDIRNATKAQNIALGTKYLSGLLTHFKGDLAKAVAAYNAGGPAVDKLISTYGENGWMGKLPSTTKVYLRKMGIKAGDRFITEGSYREDSFEKKGTGFRGILARPDGGISTELSVRFDDVNKGRDIPVLVPTLTKEEVDTVLSLGKDEDIPRAILNKAINHAESRIAQNKPVFATPTEEKEGIRKSALKFAHETLTNPEKYAKLSPKEREALHQMLDPGLETVEVEALLGGGIIAKGVLKSLLGKVVGKEGVEKIVSTFGKEAAKKAPLPQATGPEIKTAGDMTFKRAEELFAKVKARKKVEREAEVKLSRYTEKKLSESTKTAQDKVTIFKQKAQEEADRVSLIRKQEEDLLAMELKAQKLARADKRKLTAAAKKAKLQEQEKLDQEIKALDAKIQAMSKK